MIKTIRHLLLALLLVPVCGLAQNRSDIEQLETVEPDDVEIAVSAVPGRVLSTARNARPNAYIIRVRRLLEEDDETYYAFNVSQVGKYWTISVRADGKLMEVSEEGEPPVLSSD